MLNEISDLFHALVAEIPAVERIRPGKIACFHAAPVKRHVSDFIFTFDPLMAAVAFDYPHVVLLC